MIKESPLAGKYQSAFFIIAGLANPTAIYGLHTDLYAGERMVSVQKGPLYRAQGYHITIWCNVSGYQGPEQQDFQWSVYKPSAPERELQIISTQDHSFPYAVYAPRVRSREIYIERVQGDSVLLHLVDLKDEDTAEYECYTPNTDGIYHGTYSAKTNLSGMIQKSPL